MGLIKPKNNWTPVPNAWLTDKELSAKGLGILVKLQSLPDGWNFSIKGLASIMKDGIDGIRAGVQEVEKLGYLTRLESKRNEDGTFEGGDWVLHENRQATGLENPSSENPSLANPTQYNNETSKELKTNYAVGKTNSSEPTNVDVVVVERMGFNSKGEWKKNKTFYTTVEEADRVEEAGESDYPEFDYWSSRGLVGGERGRKTMRGYKKTCFKLSYPEPEPTTTLGGKKVKVSYSYEEGQ